MKMKKEFAPGLLSPGEFWRIYFRNSISASSGHHLPRASRVLMGLDQVFGRLIKNCLAKINENRVNIEYHGCSYTRGNSSPACDAHMGALQGVFETARRKHFTITRNIKDGICHLAMEPADD